MARIDAGGVVRKFAVNEALNEMAKSGTLSTIHNGTCTLERSEQPRMAGRDQEKRRDGYWPEIEKICDLLSPEAIADDALSSVAQSVSRLTRWSGETAQTIEKDLREWMVDHLLSNQEDQDRLPSDPP
ncbi:hypothetical protein D3C87_1009230 [compost metagenome]